MLMVNPGINGGTMMVYFAMVLAMNLGPAPSKIPILSNPGKFGIFGRVNPTAPVNPPNEFGNPTLAANPPIEDGSPTLEANPPIEDGSPTLEAKPPNDVGTPILEAKPPNDVGILLREEIELNERLPVIPPVVAPNEMDGAVKLGTLNEVKLDTAPLAPPVKLDSALVAVLDTTFVAALERLVAAEEMDD